MHLGGLEIRVDLRRDLDELAFAAQQFEERAEIPIALRNDTGRAGRFELSLTATGAAQVEGEAKQTLELEPGTQQLATFEVTTGAQAGPLELRAVASGNGETAHAEAELGVRADLPPVRLERAGSVDGASFPLELTTQETLRSEDRTLSLRLVRGGRLENVDVLIGERPRGH